MKLGILETQLIAAGMSSTQMKRDARASERRIRRALETRRDRLIARLLKAKWQKKATIGLRTELCLVVVELRSVV